MAETTAQQLERVQTAINEILENGQSVSLNGRTRTRADLRTLYEREEILLRRARREDGGGIRVVGVTKV